jgi:hypothetical protein
LRGDHENEQNKKHFYIEKETDIARITLQTSLALGKQHNMETNDWRRTKAQKIFSKASFESVLFKRRIQEILSLHFVLKVHYSFSLESVSCVDPLSHPLACLSTRTTQPRERERERERDDHEQGRRFVIIGLYL